MTADIKLLPCPFCGGQVFIHHGHRDIGYVTCGQRDDGSDGCGVVASFRPNKGGREATAAWNRRATAAKDAEIEALRAEVERLRMGVCGDACLHIAIERDQLKARAERLAEALRPHIEDLEQSAVVLDQYPAMAPTAAEMRKAAAELRAALHPTAAQENDDA